MFKKLAIVAALASTLALGACSGLSKIVGVYDAATTATVSADVVRPVANAFDILKGTAANFAAYCVSNQNTPSVCSVSTRRTVSQAVKNGTVARRQLRTSLATGQPATATVYNLLVDAVNALKATPANGFTGG